LFSEKDIEAIDHGLDLISQQLKEIGLFNNEIKEDIKNIKESSKRVSQKEWFLLLLGNITGWIFNEFITPEQANNIWFLIKALFIRSLP
jgi:hypothetical protein